MYATCTWQVRPVDPDEALRSEVEALFVEALGFEPGGDAAMYAPSCYA